MLYYFIIGLLFTKLFIYNSLTQYEYKCDKTQQKLILSNNITACFYDCTKGYTMLRINGYENNTIYYHIDNNNITFSQAVGYYYNLLNQKQIYIESENDIVYLLYKPAFGYFTEGNIFIPLINFDYKTIKALIHTRYMSDLYLPVCSHYLDTTTNATFKKYKTYFKSPYSIQYDNISKVPTRYAMLPNKIIVNN
jgi:hypothetical protein